MPYSHFHNWSFHTHRRRRKRGYHYNAIRRRQRPWRIGIMVILIAALVGSVGLALGGCCETQQAAVGEFTRVVSDALTEPQQMPPQTTGTEDLRTPSAPGHFGATLSTDSLQPSLSATPVPTEERETITATPPRPSPTAPSSPTETPLPTDPLRPSPTAPPLWPTATPVPTEVVEPHRRHAAAKQHMLGLINARRKAAGVRAVVLGDNIAAQLHAEASLASCSASHWGQDGLKPYMRYSLAGGYQSNGENASGLDYCIQASDGYRPLAGIDQEIADAMDGWMASPGHRQNILDPTHRKVNIGLAWDRYNVTLYQHFEGDYVAYDQLPTIKDGTLALSGATKLGVQFRAARDLGVQLYYDPPPVMLTSGQLARTYCYDGGLQVASFRELLSDGWQWTEDNFTTNYDPCPDPNDIPPDALAPRSATEAHRIWQQMYNASQVAAPQVIAVPWITATEWRADANGFAVRADISGILRQHGNGVYTVVIWGNLNGRDAVISEYSMFYGIDPPDAYRQTAR